MRSATDPTSLLQVVGLLDFEANDGSYHGRAASGVPECLVAALMLAACAGSSPEPDRDIDEGTPTTAVCHTRPSEPPVVVSEFDISEQPVGERVGLEFNWRSGRTWRFRSHRMYLSEEREVDLASTYRERLRDDGARIQVARIGESIRQRAAGDREEILRGPATAGSMVLPGRAVGRAGVENRGSGRDRRDRGVVSLGGELRRAVKGAVRASVRYRTPCVPSGSPSAPPRPWPSWRGATPTGGHAVTNWRRPRALLSRALHSPDGRRAHPAIYSCRQRSVDRFVVIADRRIY